MDETSARRKLGTGVVFSSGERNRRWAHRVMLGSLALATICGGLSSPGAREIGWGLPVGLILAGIAAVIAGNGSLRRGAPSPGEVELRSDVFVFRVRGRLGERERIVPRAEVAEGYLEAPCRVVLRLRDGSEVAFDTPDDQAAQEWLAAAGVSASARVLRVPLASAASRVNGAEMASALGLLFLTPTAVILGSYAISALIETLAAMGRSWSSFYDTSVASLVFFALVSALYRGMRPREVTVGTDGVLFEGYFGRKLVPYSTIRSIERDSHGVVALLKNGKRLPLPVRAKLLSPLPLAPQAAVGANKEIDENLMRRETLFTRIQQAMATHGQSQGVRIALDRLDRKDKPFSTWLSDMRELCTDKGGYREGRVVPEDLTAVVEDPGATPERRIGAAIALSTAGDDHTKLRIRIAVDACADEELRAALEEAAAGEIVEARVARLEKRYRA